jgi:hypothetical protein
VTNTVIQIRRSSANAAPASLRAGEMGYSYQSDKLFIGNTANVPIEIAGRYHIGVTNSAFHQANTARDHANAAFEAANSGSSGAAAFAQANTARSHANAAFLQANTAYDRANVAHEQGTAAYGQANTAYDTGVGAFTLANTVNIAAIGAFTQANAAYGRANSAYELANGAFIQANTARDHANVSFEQANTARVQANDAYTRANVAYDTGNGAFTFANTLNVRIISAYIQANTARDHANAAYFQANTGFDRANVAYDAGSGAFTFANTLNVRIMSAFAQANAANHQSIAALIQANTARDQANTGNITAIGAFTFANTLNVRIMSAFAQANAANHQSIAALIQANTARDQANNANITGMGAFALANVVNVRSLGAFEFANTLNVRIISAFTQANAANHQSIAGLIQANTARDQANAAYTRANVANLVPIGNTNAGVYTLRSTQNQINFIPGTNIGINIDEDVSGGRANITINASAGADPTAPLAFNHANAAFLQANTARDHANLAFGQANSAYDRGNVAYDTGNGAFTFANTLNVRIIGAYTQANTARDHANVAFEQANTSRVQANDAYTRANVANLVPVGNTATVGGDFVLRTTRNKLNFVAGTNIGIGVEDDAAGDRANITINATAGADPVAPLAFAQANTARDHTNVSFEQANTARVQANDAYSIANIAFARANTANSTAVGNTLSGAFTLRTNRNGLNFIPGRQVSEVNVDDWSAGDRTNVTINVDVTSPFLQANTARDIANGAWVQANTARNQANDAYTRANTFSAGYDQANTARNQANDAYTRANTANATAVGNTLSSVFTLRTNRNGINFIPGTQITAINVDDWAAGERTNVTINVDVTSPFLQANTARDHANQAFLQANTARVQANDAYLRANTFSAGYDQANTARNQANDAYTRANTANATAVGNTLSGVFTLRTNRNGLNFVPGSQVLAVNVDDWAAGERTNVTINVDVTSPFLQANTARDHANAAFLQANTARVQANEAYSRANTFSAGYDQANTARNQANDAYTRANTANSTAVGNTLSGVFTLRTNRNGLNFINGSQVNQINVDDWAAGERTNVTISVDVTSPFLQANTARDLANLAWVQANSAYDRGNVAHIQATDAYGRANVAYDTAAGAFGQANTARVQANDAYTRANTANLVPVGNTLAGVFTQRATRNKLNFIPGTNIEINVDDDSAADRVNVTIASTGSGPGGASIAVSATAPGSPTANALWWNSEIGKMFVYYDDGTSSQWVESSPGLVYANTSGGSTTIDWAPSFSRANVAHSHANAAYAQANLAFDIANIAFTQANTSNLSAVGNTLSGVFTLRSNRNGLNFISGRQISEINVDDWSAADRTNVTIHVDVTSPFSRANVAHSHANNAYAQANLAFDIANIAFTQANTSNLTAVGNTLSGVFTLRSNRNGFNFIPGRQISEINVDDWSAGNRTNVTIHVDVTAPFLAANVAYETAASGFLRANLAHMHANMAFEQANTTRNIQNTVYALANTANSHGTNTAIIVVIDGGGSAITPGEKAHLEVPFPFQIREWTIIGDQTGDIAINLWSRQYSPTALPEQGNTIINGYMTVVSGRANSNTTLANFTSTRINGGNVLVVNVATAATMTRATLTIYGQKI